MPGFLIFLVFAFLMLWLLVILPQRRRQAAQQALLAGLEPGDEVLTAGGLYGTISALGDDDLLLEIADGVEVRIARRAVAAVVPADEEGEGEADEVDALEEGGEADALAEADVVLRSLDELTPHRIGSS